jgi:hypothetical protein
MSKLARSDEPKVIQGQIKSKVQITPSPFPSPPRDCVGIAVRDRRQASEVLELRIIERNG